MPRKIQIMEGFETYLSDDIAEGGIGAQYTYFSGWFSGVFRAGLSGRGRAFTMQSNNDGLILMAFPDGPATQMTGALAVQFVSASASLSNAFYSHNDSAGSSQFSFVRDPATGRLKILRGASTGVVVATSTTIFALGSIYRLTYSVDMTAANVATVRFFVNGVLDAGLTGVLNIQQTANRNVASAVLRSPNTSLTNTLMLHIDDILVATGACEDWGPIEILALNPTADVIADFTRIAGTTNFSNLDEALLDLTTYNYSTIVGNRDLFEFGDMPVIPDAILAVGSLVWAKKDETGARLLRTNLRIGAQDFNTPDYAMFENYRRFVHMWELNPVSGLGWTAADVAGLKLGYENRL